MKLTKARIMEVVKYMQEHRTKKRDLYFSVHPNWIPILKKAFGKEITKNNFRATRRMK